LTVSSRGCKLRDTAQRSAPERDGYAVFGRLARYRSRLAGTFMCVTPAAPRRPPAGGASGVSRPLDPDTSIKGASGHWYRIEHFIGAGGNAATYLVMCTSGPHRGGPFALKFFLRMSDASRREAFLNETEFLQQCDHPAVMRVFDHGTYGFARGSRAPRYPFLVAEYLPRTVYQMIRAGTASMTERLIFATQLIAALVYLDSQDPPVVHRDIKPSNILSRERRVCLAISDFSSALRMSASKTESC
jgi:serine/threonine protein kinase